MAFSFKFSGSGRVHLDCGTEDNVLVVTTRTGKEVRFWYDWASDKDADAKRKAWGQTHEWVVVEHCPVCLMAVKVRTQSFP